MGVADLIPGVSGGTIAFIAGIYERLLAAIATFSSFSVWRELLRFQIAAAWRRSDGNFLACLLAGIATAVVLFGSLLHELLSNNAHLLLGFFFGLVLASAFVVGRELQKPSLRHVIFGLAGFLLALAVVSYSPVVLVAELGLAGVFIGGAIAICAMLLPGISGSYILLIIGLYTDILNAIHERDIMLLAVFAAGCGFGVLSFSRLLLKILSCWRETVVFFLIGVMLGASPKLWPWKEAAEGERIILQANVMPADFAGDAQVWAVLLLAVLGAAAVLALSAMARRG